MKKTPTETEVWDITGMKKHGMLPEIQQNKYQSPGAGAGRLFGGPGLNLMKMKPLFDDKSKNTSIYQILKVDQSLSVKLCGTNINKIKLFK